MFISSWRRYCKRARDITDSIDVLGHFWLRRGRYTWFQPPYRTSIPTLCIYAVHRTKRNISPPSLRTDTLVVGAQHGAI